MDSVSSVMKFSETQEARPLLIHKSSRRVSAREINRSASATVGGEPADFSVEVVFTGVFAGEAGACPWAKGAATAIPARSKPSSRTRDEFGITRVKVMRITFFSQSK